MWQLTPHSSSLYFWTPWICHMEAKSRILTLPRNQGGGFTQLLCFCLSVSLTSTHMRPGRYATQHECASLPAWCDSLTAGRCNKHFRQPFVNHPAVSLGWCCLHCAPWIESQMFGLWNGLKNKSKIIINNMKEKALYFPCTVQLGVWQIWVTVNKRWRFDRKSYINLAQVAMTT